MNRAPWTAAVLAAGLSCMPGARRLTAFSSRFPDNRRADVEAVFARLPATPSAGPRNALGVPLVVGVVQGEPRRVAAFDLRAGRRLWTADVAATSTPEILGDVVVVGEGPRVAALDVRSGAVRFRVDARSMPLLGAARDGDAIVLVFSLGNQGGISGAGRVGRVIAVDARTGGERWSHQVVGILGRPAAAAGFAFVPWNRQSLAVLDLRTGVERARVRATDDVLAWVFAGPQGVYYGSRGAYRWTPRSASGTRAESAYLENPLEGLPGDPPLYRDAFAPTTGTRTARDKIRFAFRPRAAADGRMLLEHDTLYLAYYRYLLAVDARSGAVRWARAIGAVEPAAGARAAASLAAYDVESVGVTADAVITVAGDGAVRAFDPRTGAALGGAALETSLGAIAADLEGFRPAARAATDGGLPEGERAQLVALVRDPDDRLVPIRAFLVRLLAASAEPEATRDLLELYRQRSVPPTLRREIAAALRTRRAGAEYLVAAIDGDEDRYSFLEGRAAPPLDVIAPALARMGARDAVPALLRHALDHETPPASLPAVLAAIAALGDARVVPALRAFLLRYRADSGFDTEATRPALAAVAAAVFRLGDAEARQFLLALSRDAAAQASLREAVVALFEEARRGAEGQTLEQQLAQARATLRARRAALEAEAARYPIDLPPEAFDAVWNAQLAPLRACAAAAAARRASLNEVRITVALRSEPPDDLLRTTPPTPRLPARATLPQQLAAVREQTAWVDAQSARLRAHRSTVRTTAYSPQDAELQRCMDGVLRGVRFPGFGRGIAGRTFQRQVATGRATAEPAGVPGFGAPPGSTVLVPWFLVSSPSLDPTTATLSPVVPPGRTNPAIGPGTRAGPDAGTSGTGADAGVTAGPDSGRPWWEEQ